MPSPLITAHRACQGHALENSLAGLRAGLRLGADAIEVDVQCTRDGTPVLLHDATVDRTTNGEGKLAELSLRQARNLGLLSANNRPTAQGIPTLREALQTVDGRALLVLEVKAPGIEEAVLATVRRNKALDWCVVHSFRPGVVKRIRKLEPRMPCSLLTSGRDVPDWGELFGFALSLGAQGVAIHHSVVTPELVRAAHLRELRLSTWTANRRIDVRRVAAAGVDALTTDFPDRARRWLPKGRGYGGRFGGWRR